MDEISRILAWRLAPRNKQRFANAVLTQPNPNPADHDGGRRQGGVEYHEVRRVAGGDSGRPGPGHERSRGLSSSRGASMCLVVDGIGVADRDDHSMINSDLDQLWPWP
jgi:hypothetical protein